MIKSEDLSKIKNFLEEIAEKAGKYILSHQDKITITQHKSRLDFATNIDIKAEKIIISALIKKFPNFNILSEEKGMIENHSEYTFIIDPLDGTKDYVKGITIYNTAIALQYKNDLLVGVVYRPSTNQLFSQASNLGAYLNGKLIRPSQINSLHDSFVYTYFPSYEKDPVQFEIVWQQIYKLAKKSYRIRTLADRHTMCCWVAMGGCEAFVSFDKPKIWDIAAGLSIAKQAGATITDIEGKPVSSNNVSSLVVSNGQIHKELLSVLNNETV